MSPDNDADGNEEEVITGLKSESEATRKRQMPLTAGQPQLTITTAAAAAAELSSTMDPGPSLMRLNDTKAGMTGLDKERINQVIQAASRDSLFYKRKQEKQKELDKQISQMLDRKSKVTKEQLKCAIAEMDVKAASLQSQRNDLSRIIVHVDMDMFFAAVEMRDDPELAAVPLAVGNNSMLSTSNYVARKFGVRAGMPGFIGLKLCPGLVIKPVDMKKYVTASKQVMSVVKDYDPEYWCASVDEVCCDLTKYVLDKYEQAAAEDPLLQPVSRNALSYPKSVWEMAASVVQGLRNKINDETHLTCSAGIAHNKMIAKVCSDMNKPDGQFLLDCSSPLAVQEFVANMRVRQIPGIGQVAEQKLKALGIETCRDLFENRGMVTLLFTPANIDFYLTVSLGVSSNVVRDADDAKRKSLGSERTFRDTKEKEVLNKHLSDISDQVSADLRKRDLVGKTITLLIKWADFCSNDRSKSLPVPTNEERTIRQVVQSLLERELQKKPDAAIRLLGVRVSNFADDSTPLTSSSAPPAKKSKPTSGKQRMITEFVRPAPKSTDVSQLPASFTLSSRLHPNDDYVCVYCLRQFVDESSLEKHLDKRACPGLAAPVPLPHPSKPITCPVCGSVSPDIFRLNLHLDQCLAK